MRNDQPNVRERAFTAIKIRKCSAEIDKEIICASDEKINKLLSKLVFTFYMTTGVAELGK